MNRVVEPIQERSRLLSNRLMHLDLPWWVQCIALWFAVLAMLTVVSLFGLQHIERSEGGFSPASEVEFDEVPGLWARWDAEYYLRLAGGGYGAHPDAMGFFPLFPLLMAGVARISGLNLAMAGMLIAQVSYLFAILSFYKLARLIRDDHAYAMRCVLFLLLFPSSFFYFAIYAESLYLMLAVLAVYFVLTTPPRYPFSGLMLGLASLARPVGWLLDIVLVVDFFYRRRFQLSSLISLAIGLVLSVLGVVGFVIYLYSLTGTWMAIPEVQAEWRRSWQLPWITYYRSLEIALTGNRVPGDWFLYAINWIDLGFTTLALILTAVAFKWSLQSRFPWSLSMYLLVMLIFLLSSEGPPLIGTDLVVTPLWAMTRWVAALFPLYLVLGKLAERKSVRWGGLAFSGFMLLLFTVWWTSGRWIA